MKKSIRQPKTFGGSGWARARTDCSVTITPPGGAVDYQMLSAAEFLLQRCDAAIFAIESERLLRN
jgi:hypothetical protein